MQTVNDSSEVYIQFLWKSALLTNTYQQKKIKDISRRRNSTLMTSRMSNIYENESNFFVGNTLSVFV